MVQDESHWGQIFNVAGPPPRLDDLVQQLANEVHAQTGMLTNIQRQPGPPPLAHEMDAGMLRMFFPHFETTNDEIVVQELVSFLRLSERIR